VLDESELADGGGAILVDLRARPISKGIIDADTLAWADSYFSGLSAIVDGLPGEPNGACTDGDAKQCGTVQSFFADLAERHQLDKSTCNPAFETEWRPVLGLRDDAIGVAGKLAVYCAAEESNSSSVCEVYTILVVFSAWTEKVTNWKWFYDAPCSDSFRKIHERPKPSISQR